ncbi:NADH-quinone oxidoreductase subunit M [Streptacidiphilus sp. PB12-B1b]|uniref:complex I subunit 4 family protein n=1 Tax=Streptacidiphilus sp. PB12-B1b TaxID=2705012 RepID=UPI0015FC8E96|nr:NADH-quinone oxidoreductase subunit M [Streptacidiphilus sp. PB12-B1b]QMU79391.1 NADH-quinone oxidoreductase subunit M [Streptacidiphilus sp. PB12-B1b]
MNAVLIALILLPLAGAAATLVPGLFGADEQAAGRRALRFGAAVSGLALALAVALAAGFDRGHSGRMQAVTNAPWIPAIGVRLHLGVDGISLPLLLLTALLSFLCAVYSLRRLPDGPGTPSPRSYTGLLLLLEAGMLGTFAVLDLILFFLAFEVVLIPMYFLIARWGGENRGPAANRFILYTLLGSASMLLGFLLLGFKSGTFDMTVLAHRHGAGLSHSTQVLVVFAVGLGFAVKAPMWPFHSWLPDAHTAAPTTGSVLLAGVLLKMGTYGFVRILLPATPQGMATFAPYLAAFAAVGIVYGSLACLALVRPGAKGDLKRLIAYSSVGHMGFVLLGISTLTAAGVNGALFANIAHGLITGLLFFLVGAVKDRYGTADLDTIAGATGRTGAALYGRAPRLGGLLAFAAIASLGLPGLAGFWGELLAIFGSFQPAAGLSRPAFLVFMALAGLGTLLTAAYMLNVVRRICMGDPRSPHNSTAPGIADVQAYEVAAWTPLVALTVLAGLWPAVLLGLSNPAVTALLGGS